MCAFNILVFSIYLLHIKYQIYCHDDIPSCVQIHEQKLQKKILPQRYFKLTQKINVFY